MYELLCKLLFQLDPEIAHQLALDAIGALERLGLGQLLATKATPKPTAVKAMGIDFPNRVGLAAGLDKNGDYINGLAALGFGFIEIGTVTPRPQPGNPTPRLFRIPERQAIINRMGFNNRGVDYLVERVQASGYCGVLGINIGKNFDTPVERANDDYLFCLERVYNHSSYVTVNISSPNTPGLRNLQFGDQLHSLLAQLKEQQLKLAKQYKKYVPLAIKIAPDMDADAIAQIGETLIRNQIDGVIATNTTLGREGVEGYKNSEEAGGLSGAPLTERSTQVIKTLAQVLGEKIPIIGVGGIMTGADAVDKIAAGATLVQIYSGFIYRGPELIGEIINALADQLPSPGRTDA